VKIAGGFDEKDETQKFAASSSITYSTLLSLRTLANSGNSKIGLNNRLVPAKRSNGTSAASSI
jgi:hypothetical protein